MFDLPSLTLEMTERAADWVELTCLVEPSGAISYAQVADVVHDAGLLGNAPSALYPEESSEFEETTLSSRDGPEHFAERVWGELRARAELVGEGYPFLVADDTINRLYEVWWDVPAFMMLLVADIGRHYSGPRVEIVRDSAAGRLFEKVVEASALGLFRGRTTRFGWPRDPDWPTTINARIGVLSERLGLPIEILEGKTQPQDKDKGLDVVSCLSFGDTDLGTLVLLIQCAVGENWRTKRGEPSYADWKDILQWNSALVRAVAVPWRLQTPHDRRRTFRHFDAVVLDRFRLLAGFPDVRLDEASKVSIARWCEQRLEAIPRLS